MKTAREIVQSDSMQKELQKLNGEWGGPGRAEIWLGLAARKEPQIMEADPGSVGRAIATAVGMRLEPDGIHGALVTFWNKKKGVRECQFMPMYRGLVKLARDSGEVWAVEAEVVHLGDDFEFEMGLNPKLRHVPKFNGDERDVTHAYAIARFRNGGVQFRVVPKTYLDKVQSAAVARGGKVWGAWPEEQMKKTAIKYLSKLLPQTPEMMEAIRHDNDAFGGVTPDPDALPPPTTKAALTAAMGGEPKESEPLPATESNPPNGETLFPDVPYDGPTESGG